MALPTPEAGLVISYAYLWHHEHLAGQAEGRKDRPALIVLAVQLADDTYEVTVLPISHRPPENPDWAIEIPAPVKRHLGLDEARSWLLWPRAMSFDGQAMIYAKSQTPAEPITASCRPVFSIMF